MGIVNRYGWLLLCCLLGWGMALRAQPCSVSLGADTALCAANFTLQPGVSFSVHEDSLRIVYDASQGQSGLAGAAKVYMHSGAELQPFGGWQITVGNWGQDDGLGQMKPLGNDRWQFTMHVWNYYGIAPGSALNGLFMVFRNADGTQTGKDGSGNDIWLNMGTQPPSSAFGGVSASIVTDALASILWSDGSQGMDLTVNGPGTYWVAVTDTAGCTARDSIDIALAQLPVVNLGQPAICDGQPALLDAGAGYAAYAWSTGATSPSISVASPGLYLVTVTDALGCQGIDVVQVPAQATPVAAFTHTVVPPSIATFTSSTVATTYAWDFNGDGTNDVTGSNATAAWVFPSLGSYPIRLITTNNCGADTLLQTINLAVGRPEPRAGTLDIHPNPSQGWLEVAVETPSGGELTLSVLDLAGRQVLVQQQGRVGPSFQGRLELDTLPDGLYLLQVVKGTQRMARPLLLKR
jgi:Secretion system C-terminal sorting domain/PKD domain